MIESKVISILLRVFLEHRDLIDLDLFASHLRADAADRIRAKLTRRRHSRSRRRNTPLGTLTFVCVSPLIHHLPADGGIAPPAQAICDLVFMVRRQGLDAGSLYTFRKLDQVVVPPAVLACYPQTVQRAVEALVAGATDRRRE
jgi:hypothetical protein